MSLFTHYRRLIRRALAEERRHTAGRLRNAEPDFLPAALAVIERPVSSTARITAWLFIALLLVAILWTVMGRVDIVATAQGRIMPMDSSKIVQSASTGVVRRIYVHDGDPVRAGQPLLDLDPTNATADEATARRALLAANVELARNRAIVSGLNGGSSRFLAPAGTPQDVVETQSRLINSEVLRHRATIAGMAAARRAALADAAGATAQIRKYDQTSPVLDRELAAMNGLAAKGFAPGLRLMELQRQRHAEAGDRAVASAQRMKAIADSVRFTEQLADSREQTRVRVLGDLAKAQTEVALRSEDLVKAQRRRRLQRIVAPVDGTVQQLAVHTVGGLAEAARTLMVVVPHGAVLVEARVLNRDAGFVHAGQRVAVKLEAFPFTRYGTLPGRILSISRDAVQERQGQSFYVARILLDRASIATETGQAAVTPGMTATTDIAIGSRRIITYLTGPMTELGKEAARER